MSELITIPEEIRWIIAEFSGEFCIVSVEYTREEMNRSYNELLRDLSNHSLNILSSRILQPFNDRVHLRLKEVMYHLQDSSKPFPRQRSFNNSSLKDRTPMAMTIAEKVELERVRTGMIRSIITQGSVDGIRLSDVAMNLFMNALKHNISFIIYHIHDWRDIDVGCFQLDRLTEGIDLSQAYRIDLMRKRVTFRHEQIDRFNFMMTMTVIDALIQH